MATTRKARVPMSEQIKLINECRKSGMTDADWCRENDIAVSTFYNWISRCRKAAADQILEPNYGHLEIPRPKQDVVPIDIVPDHFPEQPVASQMPQDNTHLDNSHTIEVVMKDSIIRINNEADPCLLAKTLQLLQRSIC
jgi:transposase-like protein